MHDLSAVPVIGSIGFQTAENLQLAIAQKTVRAMHAKLFFTRCHVPGTVEGVGPFAP